MEARVAQLESIVFGNKNVDSDVDLQTRLQQLEIAIASIEKARPALAELFKRASLLDSLANRPAPVVAPALKEQIILASEEDLRGTARQLASIEEFEKYINTDAISGLPPLLPAVRRLEIAEADLVAKSDQQTADLLRLLDAYNNTILLLSQKFIQLNQDIAQLEKS